MHYNYCISVIETLRVMPVSYTHLDVYKRQVLACTRPASATGTVTVNPRTKIAKTKIVLTSAMVLFMLCIIKSLLL